jgi:inner membrane protein
VYLTGLLQLILELRILALALLIPAALVGEVVHERSARSEDVQSTFAEEWGRAQTIEGPFLTVPAQRRISVNGTPAFERTRIVILPRLLEIEATIDPEVRTRGIFRATVYTSDLRLTGSFVVPEPSSIDPALTVDWSRAQYVLALADTRNISPESSATINGKTLPFSPGSPDGGLSGAVPEMIAIKGMPSTGQSYISIPITLTRGETIPFATKVSVRGSQAIALAPLGTITRAKISSTWSAPSFQGAYLPIRSEIGAQGFSGTWEVSALGRSYPEVLVGTQFDAGAIASSHFGVSLWDSGGQYRAVERSVKYAILFVALAFLCFFLFEILGGLRLHPIQYLLVGFALVLFYLVLLSLSEFFAFSLAYLLACGAILALVGGYAYAILGAGRRTVGLLGVLAILYGYLYAVLQMDDYALLAGTILLLSTLGTVMYLTRRVDWYALSRPTPGVPPSPTRPHLKDTQTGA